MTFVIVGCGTGQPVRVLHEGETVVTGSIGGPVAPSKIPSVVVPYVTAGVMHGTTDNVTIYGSLHVLMSAFAVAGADVGASVRLTQESGVLPEITASGQLLLFTDFHSFSTSRIYPDISITASYAIASDWLGYGGLHGTVQFVQPAFLVSPFVGTLIPLSERCKLQAEFMWQAANIDTHAGVFEGASSIGGHGSAGLFIGGVFTL